MTLFNSPFLGLWNGLVILWDQAKNPKDRKKYSDRWHKLGVFNRLLPSLALISPLLPSWYGKVINPILFLNGCDAYLIVLTIGVFFLLSWSGYEIPMNLIRGLKALYVKKGVSFKRRWITELVIAFLVLVWGIFGDMFCTYIDNY